MSLPVEPILVLQHHAVETPGIFAEVLDERRLLTRVIRPDLGHPVPSSPEGFRAIVVMGGPMGVYEEEQYPWLRDEDRLLRSAIERDVPALGVCLGSQLIAKAAAASVVPGPEKEIGWYRLRLIEAGRRDPLFAGFPASFEAFEWHGDIFDLPTGATGLAASERYPHQAFRLGRAVYGLLFHLEVTAQMIRDMLRAFRAEAGGRAASVETDLDLRTKALNDLGRGLFGRFLALAGE
jgi:GMP synthase (glutamine-hydrolysing)